MKLNQNKYRISFPKIGAMLHKQDIMNKQTFKQMIAEQLKDQIIRYPFYQLIPDPQQSQTFEQKYILFWKKFLKLQQQYRVGYKLQWIFISVGIILPILLLLLDLFIFQKNACSLAQLQFYCFLNELENNTKGVVQYYLSLKEITISFNLMLVLLLLIGIYKYFYDLFRSIQGQVNETNIDDLVLEINGFPFKEIFETDKIKKYSIQEAVVLLLQKVVQDEIINNLEYYKNNSGEYSDFAQINRIIIPLNGSHLLTSIRKQINFPSPQNQQQIITSCSTDSFNPYYPIFVTFNHKKQFESIYKILEKVQKSFKYKFSCPSKQTISNQSYIKLQISKTNLKDIDHKNYFKQKSFIQCHKNIFWVIFVLILAMVFLLSCLQQNITSWQVGILLQIVGFLLQKLISWYSNQVEYTKNKVIGNNILYSLITSILTQIFAPLIIWKFNRSELQLKLQDIVVSYSISNALFPQIKILAGLSLAALIQCLHKKYESNTVLQFSKQNFNYDEQLKELQINGLYFDMFDTTLFTLFFVRIAPATLILSALFKIAFRSIIQKLILLLIKKRNPSTVDQNDQLSQQNLTNTLIEVRRLQQQKQDITNIQNNVRIQTELNYTVYKRFLQYYKYGFLSYGVGTLILLGCYEIWTLDWLPPILFLFIMVIGIIIDYYRPLSLFSFGKAENNYSNDSVKKTEQAINSFDEYLQKQRKSLIESKDYESLIRLYLLDARTIDSIKEFKQKYVDNNLSKDQKQDQINYKFQNIIPNDKIEELKYKFRNNKLSQQELNYILVTYTQYLVDNKLKQETSKTAIKFAINVMSLLEFEKKRSD